MQKAKLKVIDAPVRSGSALGYARELLARCESGEVVGVTALEERRDSTYIVLGSTTASRVWTAGALLEAAITRLASDA